VRAGKIRRLIVSVPPRHLKSLLASVAFPAWCLGHGSPPSGIDRSPLALPFPGRGAAPGELVIPTRLLSGNHYVVPQPVASHTT
jgi:hypothetical protein